MNSMVCKLANCTFSGYVVYICGERRKRDAPGRAIPHVGRTRLVRHRRAGGLVSRNTINSMHTRKLAIKYVHEGLQTACLGWLAEHASSRPVHSHRALIRSLPRTN